MTYSLWLIGMMVQVDQPVVAAVEPASPTAFATSLAVTCPGHRLLVTGIGQRRPEGLPEITLNGVPLRGVAVDALRRDLANWRGVYQFGAGCDQRTPGLHLSIYSAQGPANHIVYRVGSATIRGEALIRYRPLRATSAENFYWRN